MPEKTNAKRFIEAYNRLDQGMRDIYGIKRSMTFSDMIRQVAGVSTVIKKYKDDLIDCGRLRNAIVHNNTDDEVIAEPNEEIVLKLELITRLVTTPPRVMESIAARAVFSVQTSAKLSFVLSELYKTGYSVVPVYEHKQLVGVINRKMIVDCIGKCIMEGRDIDEFMNGSIEDRIQIKAYSSHFEVVPSNITIDNMIYLFQQNKKLSVVIITANGNYDEDPIGVVVANDTIEMQSILDKY